MNLRVMTFNIQHGEDHVQMLKGEPPALNFQQVADVIRRFQPDIIGLNEVRDRGAAADYREQTKIIADLLGYEHYYFAKAIDFGGDGPYGNAIISRFPMRAARPVHIPDPQFRTQDGYYETRCVLKAEFDAPARFDVLIAHFGLNPSEHRNAVATVMELLETRGAPVVFMGDLNMTPDNPVLAPLYAAMNDTGALLPPGAKSFPSEAPTEKIDYIFATREFHAERADIPQIVASDHCPYVADLTL